MINIKAVAMRVDMQYSDLKTIIFVLCFDFDFLANK